MKEGVITRFKKFINGEMETRKATYGIAPTYATGIPYGTPTATMSIDQAMRLSAVYRCVDVISSSIASQSFLIREYKRDRGWFLNEVSELAYMLNFSPSNNMSRFILMKTAMSKVLLEGNAYIMVNRNGSGNPTSLKLITDIVKTYQRDDGTVYYKILKKDQEDGDSVEDDNIIHLMNYTYDGLIGVSTITHAINTLDLANNAEMTAKGFFTNGSNINGIIYPTGTGKITPEQARNLKDAWSNAFNSKTDAKGGVVVMESGLKFDPVSINPKDAQMLETRQFNVVDICRFFGVSPSKVFDNANLTYSNIESFQLGFLTDTISPMDSNIESEFNRKLLRPSQRRTIRVSLSIEELTRANLDAKANWYTKMFQLGVYSPNDIRRELGKSTIDKGDSSYIQVNLYPIDMLEDILGAKIPAKQPKDNNTNNNTI